jgi:hypothetical protein
MSAKVPDRNDADNPGAQSVGPVESGATGHPDLLYVNVDVLLDRHSRMLDYWEASLLDSTPSAADRAIAALRRPATLLALRVSNKAQGAFEEHRRLAVD